MKKKLLIGALVLVGLVVLALVLVVLNLDSLIKKGVETIGPQVTKVDVKLDSARISLLGGSGSIRGLTVGNPAGYKSTAAIQVGAASLALVPGSLFGDKVHIKSIVIDAPAVTIEGGLKDNNLTKILANVQAFSGTNAAPAAGAAPQKKLQVDSLRVTGAKVSVALGLLGGKPMTVTVPDIELSNLGQGAEGITAGDLTARVLDALIGRTLASVTDSVGKLGKEAINTATDAASVAAREALKGVDGAGKEAGKAVKGVTDLFKKK